MKTISVRATYQTSQSVSGRHIEKVTVLAFVTRLMAIKSKFFFSNNCYKELLKLVGDVLLNPNKLLKDMYDSKKLVKGLGMDYEKIDVCQNSCMIF
jgi:hypothetical protein